MNDLQILGILFGTAGALLLVSAGVFALFAWLQRRYDPVPKSHSLYEAGREAFLNAEVEPHFMFLDPPYSALPGTVVHELKGHATGLVHPELLPPHRISHSCVHVLGRPDCYGAAEYGEDHCTCDMLTVEQHQRCEDDARAARLERGNEMCHDCAFRKGSPEQDKLDRIAEQTEPFRCHQGMPVRAIGGVPQKDDYQPRNRDQYPICAGWWRAQGAKKRLDVVP